MEPHVVPLAIFAAPHRPVLAVELAGARGDRTEPIDRNLHRHHLAAFARIPAAYGVDLPGERIEPESASGAEKQREFVVGRAARDRALEQVDLFASHLAVGWGE